MRQECYYASMWSEQLNWGRGWVWVLRGQGYMGVWCERRGHGAQHMTPSATCRPNHHLISSILSHLAPPPPSLTHTQTCLPMACLGEHPS